MPGVNATDGYPTIAASDPPDVPVHMNAVAAYAAARGTRLIGTTAQRTAYAYKKKGLRWFDTSNNTDYIHNGTGWEADSALDTGWVNLTLINGWTALGSETPKFRVKNGYCQLAGRIVGTSSSNTQFATLPVNARHGYGNFIIFPVIYDGEPGNPGLMGGAYVGAGGELVMFQPGSGTRSAISLGSIHFPVG